MEGAREGRRVVDLTESGCQVLTRSDVLDGLPQMLREVTVSAWHLARMHEDS